MYRGRLAYELGHWEQAKDALSNAHGTTKRQELVLHYLGEAQLQSQDIDTACQTWSNYINFVKAPLISEENVRRDIIYGEKERTENVLVYFRRHLPVGYHGRASSIILSGQPIHRPKGQTKPADGDPIFGPCRLLDFELEMAFVIGKKSQLGDRISTDQAGDHIFGMVLFNDWSARDIQKWEYVPLGPFLGKSFASSISPWVVTMEALSYFKVAGPVQEPKVLPYLEYEGDKNYDINLQVSIAPEGGEETVISNSNYKYMYWNQEQQLAHHTVNGCNVNVGDMMASGTISGKDEHSYGSLLEITQAGKKTLTLNGGEERKFIQDNDTVTMRGYCEKDGRRVGFGEVSAKILPAK